MIVFLNGQFVSEQDAKVSIFDRSFLFGDGVFETLRVAGGRPFRWNQHLERLQCGAEFLRIRLPFAPEELKTYAAELVQRAAMPDCLLRIHLSRGVGLRGYSARGADQPSLVMTLHPAPEVTLEQPVRWRLATSSLRLADHDRLAGFKTCNKLPQVLARFEAEADGADEALLIDAEGRVIEAAAANLFWLEDHTVCTPPLDHGVLPGITRAAVLEICKERGLSCQERSLPAAALHQADGVFLTLSSLGIVEAIALNGSALRQSPLTAKLHRLYQELLSRETRGM